MYMLKLLFQKLQIRPVLAPGETADLLGHCWRLPPPGDHKRHLAGPLSSSQRPPPQLTANCLECCSFFHLILPESQSPHPTLFIPCYKKSGLEREGKMVCQGMNPPSSQIAGHLNKAPIKIQSLSLLIGFGSDRQPECRCLFQFHLYRPWGPAWWQHESILFS